MTTSLAAALIYWVIVAIWLTVLATIVYFYIRNPQAFDTTRLLLAVLCVDAVRNLVENIYFGLYFGSRYQLFSAGRNRVAISRAIDLGLAREAAE